MSQSLDTLHVILIYQIQIWNASVQAQRVPWMMKGNKDTCFISHVGAFPHLIPSWTYRQPVLLGEIKHFYFLHLHVHTMDMQTSANSACEVVIDSFL
jgi:hypothetical protein